MRALWQKEERSVQIFIPYERPFSQVFGEEEWLMGTTHSTWYFGPASPCWSEIADFEPIFGCSASAVTSSEESSINTNRKSTKRFPVSLRWSSYVVPDPWLGSKMQNVHFRCKIALRLKKVKVCYRVSSFENCQQQRCKAFIGLTIRVKMIGGVDPFYQKFWVKVIALERNLQFSIYFRS